MSLRWNGGACRCASSKHLQTRRFLDTLQGYLHDVHRMLVQLHRAANERPAPFIDHSGTLRDSKTGRPIHGGLSDDDDGDEDGGDGDTMRGCRFPSCARVWLTVRRRRSGRSGLLVL